MSVGILKRLELLNVIVSSTEKTDIISLPERRVMGLMQDVGTISLRFWSTHSCRNRQAVLRTCGISIRLSFVVQRIIDLSLICASRVLIGDVGSRKQQPTPVVGVLLIRLSLHKDPSS